MSDPNGYEDLEAKKVRDLERKVELLTKYGEKKFGDEWWPGSAGDGGYLTVDEAWELDDLGYDQGKEFRAEHPREPRVRVVAGRIIEEDQSAGTTTDLTDQAKRVLGALVHATESERVWRAAQEIANELGWLHEDGDSDV